MRRGIPRRIVCSDGSDGLGVGTRRDVSFAARRRNVVAAHAATEQNDSVVCKRCAEPVTCSPWTLAHVEFGSFDASLGDLAAIPTRLDVERRPLSLLLSIVPIFVVLEVKLDTRGL